MALSSPEAVSGRKRSAATGKTGDRASGQPHTTDITQRGDEGTAKATKPRQSDAAGRRRRTACAPLRMLQLTILSTETLGHNRSREVDDPTAGNPASRSASSGPSALSNTVLLQPAAMHVPIRGVHCTGVGRQRCLRCILKRVKAVDLELAFRHNVTSEYCGMPCSLPSSTLPLAILYEVRLLCGAILQ